MENVPDGRKSRPEMHDDGMAGLAEEMVRHHEAPMPSARRTKTPVFPVIIFRRLAAGVGIGSILGLLLGTLLFHGVVTIPQAEELYSMDPVGFHLFWAFQGIVAGMVCFGVWGIITVPD